MVFIAVEQASTGGDSDVSDYCATYGWNFLVGRDVTHAIFHNYDTDRHNYFVIDRDGIIRFRATRRYTGAPWSTYLPQVKAALDAALMTPVEPVTWSRVKSLFH